MKETAICLAISISQGHSPQMWHPTCETTQMCVAVGGGEIHDCATSMYSIIRDSRIFEDDQKLRKALRVTDRVKYDAC